MVKNMPHVKPLLPMRARGDRWTTYKHSLSCVLLLILVLVQGCSSLNPEGLALLDFRTGVSHDPYGAFTSWNRDDDDPCSWSNVHCVDGNVHVLHLKGLSLEGVLAPQIGNLTHLRRLVLSQNKFSGVIPKDFGELSVLEVLDLRDNNLSGHIPSELGRMHSLKRLLLCNNNLEGSIPTELRTLNFLYEIQYDDNVLSLVANGIGCRNKKSGRRIYKSSPNDCVISEKLGELESEMVHNVVRRKLAEESLNLAAAPSTNVGVGLPTIIALPTSRSSGSYPAVPTDKKEQHPISNPPPPPPPPLGIPQTTPETVTSNQPPANRPTDNESEKSNPDRWKIWLIISCLLLLIIIAIALWCVCRSRAVKTIGPWRTGISGQLQKAFVTGEP